MIDLTASHPRFLRHLLPVWRALPEHQRGVHHAELGTLVEPPLRPVLVAHRADALWAARAGREVVLAEHGIGQSYDGRRPGETAYGSREDLSSRVMRAVRLYLAPGPRAAEQARQRLPGIEVVECGPTWLRPERAVRQSVVAVLLRSGHVLPGVPETRGAWSHYLGAIGALRSRYEVVGHAHPAGRPDWARRWRECASRIEQDYERVLAESEVLIGDNTSALYEAALLGVPVVVLNAPWYRREIEHGLRFWEAAGVGVQVADPADLAAAVDLARAGSPELRAARAAALALVYSHRDGGAERGARAIADWMAARGPAVVT